MLQIHARSRPRRDPAPLQHTPLQERLAPVLPKPGGGALNLNDQLKLIGKEKPSQQNENLQPAIACCYPQSKL